MNKKMILGLVGILLAGTVFAETPLVEKIEETIDFGFDVVFDFEELINENDLPLKDVIIDDVELTEIGEVDKTLENKKFLDSDEGTVKVFIAGEYISLDNDVEMLRNTLIKRHADENDIAKAVLMYAYEVNAYSLEKNERKLLLKSLEENSNSSAVFETFEFLELTPYKTSALEDVINIVSEKNISVEEAYALYSGKENEELTVDDVAYFVSQGISVDDIVAMYEISLGTEKGLKTMLNERLNGSSWNEIVAVSHNACGGFEVFDFTPREILYGISIARIVDIPFSDLAQNCSEKGFDLKPYAYNLNKKMELQALYTNELKEFDDDKLSRKALNSKNAVFNEASDSFDETFIEDIIEDIEPVDTEEVVEID